MLDDNRRTRIILYLGLAVFVIFALIPFYWMIRTSILTDFAAIDPSTPIFPTSGEVLSLEAYSGVWEGYDMTLFYRNSVIIALGATIISLLISIPGAYAFARLDFPGRQLLFYTAVFTIMFPWIVITIPVYEVFFWLGLVNTMIGIIIAIAIFTLPQNIWLLQGFFRQGIPANIEEAALIDGNTEITAFLRIVLPLSAPAIGAAALFSFLIGWNNFLWVFILASDESNQTATVAIHFILGSDVLREWPALMAATVILIIPPILFYGFAQRYVGSGLGGGQY